MPATLTAEERAAIDAAVAAGKVRRLARGESGFDLVGGVVVYRDTGESAFALRKTTALQAKQRTDKAKAIRRDQQPRPLDPKVQARIATVGRIIDAGGGKAEILAALPDIKPHQINYCLSQLGKKLPRSNAVIERRARIKVYAQTGELTGPEICEREGISRQQLAKDLQSLGVRLKNLGGAYKTRRKRPEVQARLDRVAALVAEGLTAREIAERIERPVGGVRQDLDKLGLKAAPALKGNRGSGDVAAKEKRDKQGRARDKMQAVVARDRRRFKTGPIATGTYGRTAPQGIKETLFPNMRREPGAEAVLKDGCHSQKIGGDVLVGRLKGAKIFTLTLEERATCPASCQHWLGCYGNGMNRAPRFVHGPALQKAIREEVAAHCKRHGLVLIRLHVLGDFYSPGYVSMWSDLLALHPNLTLFGFTGWREGTKIGDAIASVRAIYPLRFMIRESGRTGRWGSFSITDPLPEKTIGDAVVCPEQRETNLGETDRHCGNCAVCWSTDAPVAFIKH